jgi:hypothetical protein
MTKEKLSLPKVQAKPLNKMAAEPEAGLIRWLAIACIAAAILSSLLLGFCELARPVFGGARYRFNPVPPAQLWSYGILQAFKSVGFIAGLFGLFLVATRRGILLKIIMGMAVLGGTFHAFVWMMIAVTARDDAIYVFNRPIGSDAHSNGGLLFLSLAPVAIGVAALLTHRISRWKSIWAIIVGLLDTRIFGLFVPGTALIIEGVSWLVLGYIVYISRRND